MRNIFKKSLFLLTFISFGAGISHAQTGTYSTRVISSDGTASTWTFILPSSQVTIPANTETEDNDIIYAPSGSSKMKFSSSNQFSWQGQSSGYIPVPSGGAGTISMTVKGQSDSRYLQLYVNGTAAAETKRLYSKASSDGNITSDGKKGPQSFTFTASDLTTKGGKTYLHLKDNNTEMKIATFTVTLTTGSYSGGSTPTTIPVTGVTLNKESTSIEAGQTELLTATVAPSNATDQTVSWSSDNTAAATVSSTGLVTAVAEGTATITVRTNDGNKTATCTVTVTAASSDPVAVTGVTISKAATSVNVGATVTLTATVAPANATNKSMTWSTSDANTVTVSGGTITGVAAGTAKVYVTTVDGGFKDSCTVAVTATPTPPPPSTDLTTHLPEVYEAREVAGGYNTPLKVIEGREYEVYYINRDENSKLSVNTSNADKSGAITNTEGDNGCRARDNWFYVASSGSGGDTNGAAKDEFGQSIRKVNMKDGNEIVLHVAGFDQFSFYGKDNSNSTSKCFEVYINGVKQSTTPDNNYTIRRFSLTGESLIRITALSTSSSNFVAFSLRLAEEPRVKYLDGNDSTQIVYQTQAPAPVYYYTKYNSKGHTSLVWTGAEATGITLSTFKSDALGDTLELSGIANCAVGTYNYRVVSYNSSNQETSSVPGKIKVETLLRSTSRDTVFEAFTGEEMDQIAFSYYAKNPATDITLTWNGANPGSGVTGSVSNNKYVIHGIPSTAGNFKFTVSIAGGNSINGELIVTTIDMTDHPVMYLYKNSGSYENDGVYKYLTSGTPKIANLIPRKAQETGPRASYGYEWILISNDVDANNPEVLALIKDNVAHKPILNMQGFTYAADRLNWGEPNNGTMDTVSKNGCNIFIQQPEHPIFNNIVYTQGSGKLKVLNSADKKSVMPIDINNCPGSLCLATAYTRNRDDYYQDGELQTIIHEVPTKGSKPKYICFPLANTKDNLTNEGKLLLKNIVTYLTNSQSSVALPTLKMESFSVHGYEAVIDQNKDLITLELTEEQFVAADSLKAEKPVITVKDAKTHVNPSDSVDLRYTTFMPKTFVVTDYINRRAYSFKVTVKRTQGIEDVYEAGQWVNIFDIYGRKIATTNEDIYTMELPRGIYIIVTENGGTIKIMK